MELNLDPIVSGSRGHQHRRSNRGASRCTENDGVVPLVREQPQAPEAASLPRGLSDQRMSAGGWDATTSRTATSVRSCRMRSGRRSLDPTSPLSDAGDGCGQSEAGRRSSAPSPIPSSSALSSGEGVGVERRETGRRIADQPLNPRQLGGIGPGGIPPPKLRPRRACISALVSPMNSSPMVRTTGILRDPADRGISGKRTKSADLLLEIKLLTVVAEQRREAPGHPGENVRWQNPPPGAIPGSIRKMRPISSRSSGSRPMG